MPDSRGYLGNAPAYATSPVTSDPATGNVTGVNNLTASGTVTATGIVTSSQNGGQLAGLRNRIINGDMRIDQRNNGAAVTPVAGVNYVLDRYRYTLQQSSKLTFQQVADAPPGFKFSTKISVAAQYSPLAADVFMLDQPVEGQNIVDFQLGAATAQTVTLSFWVKGSVAGTYSVYFTNGTRSYIATFAVSSGWVKQSVTLTLDTTGTWPTDNTTGLYVGFDLGSGSNYYETSGSWQALNARRTSGSTTFVNQVAGSTLNITGVQLELGSVATPFETRPIGTELALCQRYLPAYSYSGGNGYVPALTTTVTAGYAVIPFQVVARVSPTSITISNATHFVIFNAVGAILGTTAVAFNASTSTISGVVSFVTAGVAAGAPAFFGWGNSAAQILFNGAEL